MQAVSDAAGVTKGGLFHHFPSKQALIAEIFATLTERLDAEIDAAMVRDPSPSRRLHARQRRDGLLELHSREGEPNGGALPLGFGGPGRPPPARRVDRAATGAAPRH
nr:helix-turn-helix domain-containing protein [Methylorubrum extorquens]